LRLKMRRLWAPGWSHAAMFPLKPSKPLKTLISVEGFQENERE
jgi:hypothetical protein